MLMNKFITTLLCLAGSAILFNANAVEREYTQFTAFNADGSIPNGKYIFAAPTSSGQCRYMRPKAASTSVYGLASYEVSYDSNKHFTGNSDCEFTIQQSSDGKYSIIANNGQYVYTTGGFNLSLNSSNGNGFWSLNTNPSGDSNVSTLGKALCFYNGDNGIKLRNGALSVEKDFASCSTSTKWSNASNSTSYPYPTIYTAVPAAFAVKGVTGANETTLSNNGTFYVLVDNSSNSKVNFNADGAYKIDYTVAGSTTTVMGDTFDYPVPTSIGTKTITVTPYDANGKVYTEKSFSVTINVGEAPVIPQNDEAVTEGSQENTWSADVTEDDATGVSLTSYAIDGTSTVASKPNGVLTISDFSLKNARYMVQASNNFLANQSLEFNFISTINNKLSALHGDAAPYQAYIVFTNNSDRVTEGCPQSIDIRMTPNSDYTEWTCDFDNILDYSAQELFYYIPWIATEFKIELKIVPRDSNTPMILSGKGMSVAEMPGRNREAAARITAQDSTPYSFVVDGGEPLIYNAGLSADESTYNMIAGSAKFEPFVTNSINLSASSNIETGITDINPDANDAQYYNLQGIRVDNPENGIYIRRQGNKTTKVIL